MDVVDCRGLCKQVVRAHVTKVDKCTVGGGVGMLGSGRGFHGDAADIGSIGYDAVGGDANFG